MEKKKNENKQKKKKKTRKNEETIEKNGKNQGGKVWVWGGSYHQTLKLVWGFGRGRRVTLWRRPFDQNMRLWVFQKFSFFFEMLEIKCIIHAVVNSLCGLRSCLSCSTCTAFVCCTDTLRIQAITAEELESRFASEWETDHLPLS